MGEPCTVALAGLRVVDLSNLLAAPQVSALLGDFGADVLKLEPPDGDPLQGLGAVRGGRSVGACPASRSFLQRPVLRPRVVFILFSENPVHTAGRADLRTMAHLRVGWAAPTDPAVVFSLLANRAIAGRTPAILEGESGFNDPAVSVSAV